MRRGTFVLPGREAREKIQADNEKIKAITADVEITISKDESNNLDKVSRYWIEALKTDFGLDASVRDLDDGSKIVQIERLNGSQWLNDIAPKIEDHAASVATKVYTELLGAAERAATAAAAPAATTTKDHPSI